MNAWLRRLFGANGRYDQGIRQRIYGYWQAREDMSFAYDTFTNTLGQLVWILLVKNTPEKKERIYSMGVSGGGTL